jgi:lysozyme family protein
VSIERFNACLAVTLEYEGGFSDDPHDNGGATNLGIEYTEWRAWQMQHGLSGMELMTPGTFARELTVAEVTPLYLANYWEPINDGSLAHPVDMIAFDCAVNEGVGKARQFLAETAGETDPMTRAHAIQDLRTAHYNAIVANNPSQHVFLDDWLGRVNSLTRKIDNHWI